jgi:hypothetical protein
MLDDRFWGDEGVLGRPLTPSEVRDLMLRLFFTRVPDDTPSIDEAWLRSEIEDIFFGRRVAW